MDRPAEIKVTLISTALSDVSPGFEARQLQIFFASFAALSLRPLRFNLLIATGVTATDSRPS
jgi:hypothetical protein